VSPLSRSADHGCPRRRFLREVAGTAAALGVGACGGGGGSPSSPGSATTPTPSAPVAALGPRVRQPNPFVTADGRPVLVSVEGRDFDLMLERGLRELGGLARLISGGSDVLVNPNFNLAEEYPGISRASSVVAVVREARAVTTGQVAVADEGYDPGPAVYTYLGLYDAVAAVGGEVGGFGQTHAVRREAWAPSRPNFEVYTLAYEAPIILSLCNVKRHRLAGYSCAIKNNVGIVPGSGATLTRAWLHSPANDLLNEVAEIAGLVNPELFIVDAQSILTVRGPSIAEGVPVEAHRLILCGDMLATDAYCTRLLEAYDPGYQARAADRLLGISAALGLGQPDLAQVDVRELTVSSPADS